MLEGQALASSLGPHPFFFFLIFGSESLEDFEKPN
jgi:hypothetical protein